MNTAVGSSLITRSRLQQPVTHNYIRRDRAAWKAAAAPVAIRHDRRFDRNRPSDHQYRIVPGDAAVMRWIVEIRGLILYFGSVLERPTTMGKPRRYPEKVPIISGQYRSWVAPESGGAALDIDRNIENRTAVTR